MSHESRFNSVCGVQVSANEVSRRLLSEKDRQLELLREREQQLARELAKFRDSLQQLTDPETNDYDALLKAQVLGNRPDGRV